MVSFLFHGALLIASFIISDYFLSGGSSKNDPANEDDILNVFDKD